MIALYPGAFKPPHRGHFNVVKSLLDGTYNGAVYDKDSYKDVGPKVLKQGIKDKPKIEKVIVFAGGGERNGISKEESLKIWEVYAQHLGNVEIRDGEKNPMFAARDYARENNEQEFAAVTGIRGEQDFVDLRRVTTFSNTDNVKGLALGSKPGSGVRATDFRNSVLSGNLDKIMDFFPRELSKEEVLNILTDLKDKIVAEVLANNIEGFISEYFTNEDTRQEAPSLTKYMASLLEYMIDQGLKITPLPEIKTIRDEANAKDVFGRTAYYDPNNKEIVLYIEGRHDKDILRSFSHEMIHHMQNLEGRLSNIQTTNTNESGELEEIEKEAYLMGNITFRNWEDELKNETKKVMAEGKYDSIVTYLTKRSLEAVKNALIKKNNFYKEGHFGDPKTEDAQVAMSKATAESYPIFLLSVPEDIDKEFQKETDLDFDYEMKAIFVKGSDALMRNGGAYKGGFDEKDAWVSPKVELEFVLDPYNFPRDFEELSGQISDVLRHEIEHLTQAGGNERGKSFNKDSAFGGKFGTEEETAFRNMIEKGIIANGVSYLTLPSEIDANIQGLYLSAKKQKRPFVDVVDQYLYQFTDQYDKDGKPYLTKQDVEDVKKVWALRLPALGIKQKL